jgi:PAS domain S-box-containing protein
MVLHAQRAALRLRATASGPLRRLPSSPQWVLSIALVTVVAIWALGAGGTGPLAIAGAAAAGASGLSALALAALQREAALRRRWDTCVEVASDWYWEMDADLRFIYLSPNFTATTGIPVTRVVGRRREDVADAATRESASWHGHVADLAARRPFRDFAYDGRDDDGAPRHFMISGKPVFDGDGCFTGYCGIGRDVTALQRAEGRLADAIEAMDDAFVLWDAEDRLVLWNGAVQASDIDPYPGLHVGLRYEDVLRARVKAGHIADAVGRDEEYITERLARRRTAEPFIQRLTDGRWVRVRQHRTRDGGLVVIRSDITDLKVRELELQRAETRLTDAIEAMSDASSCTTPTIASCCGTAPLRARTSTRPSPCVAASPTKS